MINALTFDVEEWFHPIRFYRHTKEFETSRLEPMLDVIREMLADAGARATFYWVGELAHRHGPHLRSLVSEGHEIGCHSLHHDRFVYDMGPLDFLMDTKEAKAHLEDAAGVAVRSYRAPCFSITNRSLWAFDILEEMGFETDSSVFPVLNWRYGMASFPRRPVLVGRQLLELPLPVISFGGLAFPASGGAYFRLYPYAWSRRFLRAVENDVGGVFYLHPWELDPGHPRIDFHRIARATHYMRLGTTRRRLRRLLKDFRFSTAQEYSLKHRSTSSLIAYRWQSSTKQA
jgi:polysaccharide deacetylase family protein (PEP-CTERM system associated)